jgi:uncharacterized protein (TIGR03435 family)
MYVLTVAKGGTKLKETRPESTAAGTHEQRRLGFTGRGSLESHGTSMRFLTHLLSEQLGRTVEDKTGLAGNYDYTLHWTPDEGTPMQVAPEDNRGEPPPDAGGPSLMTAIEEQLGLKLESRKGPVDVIVVDQIDKPSPN